MRFAFIPVVLLAASFTLAATPTATADATVAPNKLDVSKPPPPPSSVNVLNFPEVQAVEGTVAVSNLPAVQTVGGTVNVGNLPLDADGAVRVAGACPTAPPLEARYINLLPDGPITLGPREVFNTQAVEARGFSRVGVVTSGARIGMSVE